jgi:hypothetical protein
LIHFIGGPSKYIQWLSSLGFTCVPLKWIKICCLLYVWNCRKTDRPHLESQMFYGHSGCPNLSLHFDYKRRISQFVVVTCYKLEPTKIRPIDEKIRQTQFLLEKAVVYKGASKKGTIIGYGSWNFKCLTLNWCNWEKFKITGQVRN